MSNLKFIFIKINISLYFDNINNIIVINNLINLSGRKFYMEIYTERLKLIPLTQDDIEMSLESLENFYKENSYKSDKQKLSNLMYKIYKIKLVNMKGDPDNYLFYTYWLIIKRKNNEIIGRIGFKNIPDDNLEIEIGYGIGIEFRSKGYMTEALKAMLKWGFKQTLLPIETIVAKTKNDNIPSQKVLKKAGFKYISSDEDLMCWKLNKES